MFRLVLDDATFSSPMELAAAVFNSAKEGSLSLGNTSPSEWLLDGMKRGVLDPEMVRGLVATLIQSNVPGALTEGSKVAVAAHMPELSKLILLRCRLEGQSTSTSVLASSR